MKKSKVEMVKDFIFREIKDGKIKNGQRLPSCREVSSYLSINKITVNKAYNELEREHKVYSIPRGGFYLIDSEERLKVVQEEVDFRTVKPDEKLIPYREFTHVMNKAVDMYKNTLFEYESSGGLSSLRDTLKYEFEKDGIYTAAERIIITNGAQQAIGLVFQYLFGKSKGKLLVESPTYSLALKLADHLGIDIIGIERRVDGFDYKEMEIIFKSGEITAFYVIPRHHNPTGYTLSEKDKQKIAELSYKYNVLIIEDDYLADLGSRKGSMSIHYYDISKRTIYIRSFSKAFMPGIRMGAAVLPESMIEEVINIKHISDLNTSKIPQAALDIFIKSGMYEKHIKKVKKSYETKLKKAAKIVKSLSPLGFSWYVPEHGIFIWLYLPENIEAVEFEKKLEHHGILVKAALEFFPEKWSKEKNQRNYNYIRICISGVPQESIDALATIISVMKAE
ncbi:PLP-dependent aminotransferase family protein [Tissierella carlieri]|uniref:aminotransferase-like domain-containing protein n=1 Tax=Tissierella carlieri TaxID=689904 RepID=UPI001C114C1E|nr:PLP-dependent aminotransferase family protein [Tissierella carlieri]MBU5314008.1 PLP-dependent aminotransferase family protein [Tissierella carlieri]